MVSNMLSRVDPFTFVDDVFRSFRPLLEDRQSGGFVPAVETRRDGDDLVVKVDLPGIDPAKDVDVELNRNVLTISGERRTENESEGFHEVRYGTFSRSITVPGEISADAISADYDAGVLTVRVAGAYTSSSATKIQVTRGGSKEAIEG